MQIKAVCTIAVLIVSTCFSLPVFADPISFNVQLSGANEVPAMKSQGAGNAHSPGIRPPAKSLGR
jgi:hypothetical protein